MGASGMGASGAPDPLGAMVRRRDPERYLAALFAPAMLRPALLALYGFAAELARAPLVTHEPTIALIRLMWWRETVEGAARAHEVATPLAAALAAGMLDRDQLLAVIAAWERAVEAPIADRAGWRAWAEGSAGGIAVAAGHLLGAPAPEALRPLGAAEGAARLLRARAALPGLGFCLLPADALAAHGVSVADLAAGAPMADALRRALATEALSWLPAPLPRPGRTALAAVLSVVPARRDLRRAAAGRPMGVFGLGARLAMLAASGGGRV